MQLIPTDAYSLEIGSASGAVGDVVPVTVILHSGLENPGSPLLELGVCHNPDVAEIVGGPVIDSEYLSMLNVLGFRFFRIDERVFLSRNDRGFGFTFDAAFDNNAYNLRFPSGFPLVLMTLYYRLKGQPGDSTLLRFCDAELEFANRRCIYNRIHAYTAEAEQGFNYIARQKIEGTLTILPGPATRPDRPPEPEPVKTYAALPTAEEANFRIRIDDVEVDAGTAVIEVLVHATADVEYSGILIPVTFDKRYLALAFVDQQFLGGIASTNYPSGNRSGDYVVIYSGLGGGADRLASEGEEVLAATIYFHVLDAARQVPSTPVRVGGPANAHIIVNYEGEAGDVLRGIIPPVAARDGTVWLNGGGRGLRGDANDDGLIDISDPLALLSHLFLGGNSPACPVAGDFNVDGKLDVADPIAILGFLFQGGPDPGGGEPVEVACE